MSAPGGPDPRGPVVPTAYDGPTDETTVAVGEEAGDGQALDEVLQRVSTARHEVNNHLMTALAEVQLLLFDAESEEVQTACETVQEALRSIRAVIASLSDLKP